MRSLLESSACAGVEVVPGGYVEYASGAGWWAWFYDSRGEMVRVQVFDTYGALRARLATLRAGLEPLREAVAR